MYFVNLFFLLCLSRSQKIKNTSKSLNERNNPSGSIKPELQENAIIHNDKYVNIEI